jgi:opacity protein-like surface antigen
MKKFALAITIGLFRVSFLFAQNEKTPEFFAGYSFESVETGATSADLGTTTTLDNRFKANGFNLSAAGYFTKRFGIAGDFSANYNNRDDVFGTTTGQTKFSLYNITGGPQIRFASASHFTPFAQALVGVARRNVTETITSTATTFTDKTTSFAMNFGGGVDYKLSDRLAWRIFQFDYNPILLRARTVDSIAIPAHTLNGFRFSTGIVIK